MSEKKTHRIFFALWPDDALRQQIQQTITPHLARNNARRVPIHNWHITLAFLGNVSEQNYECALQQASEVVAQPFDLQLDQCGYWPRPRVVWLGCSTVPDSINHLVTNLNSALKPCDYKPEQRIFSPHLTLLRKANRGLDVRMIEPICWHVDHFVLVESVQTEAGTVYEVAKGWPLQ